MEKNVLYIRNFKKKITEQDETGLRHFNTSNSVTILFASIYSTMKSDRFEENFIPVKYPEPIDFENEFCYYTVGDKIFIHDSVSIFSKYNETINPKEYYVGSRVGNNVHILHGNFFCFKNLIENDKYEFVNRVEQLKKIYNNLIYNKINEGVASVNEEDRDRLIGIVILIMELLFEITVKYHFFAFRDHIENQLNILKNDEERLLFLNKHLKEQNEIEESYFYTIADEFVEPRTFDWYYMQGGCSSELQKDSKESNKVTKKYLEKRIYEIKFSANKNTKLNKPTTIDQQLLILHYLEKVGFIKDLHFGTAEKRNVLIHHLFSRSNAAVKKRSNFITQEKTKEYKNIWDTNNFILLRKIFEQIGSKELLEALKIDFERMYATTNITWDSLTRLTRKDMLGYPLKD